MRHTGPCLSCLCLWPIQAPCWYKPYALPRQPVVFYDETRWDLERDVRRGGKRDGFFSSDTPVEELQRPIFISEEKLRGVWVMDMTTNAVLRPMMCSVCPSCSVSMMILSPPVWLSCLVVRFWIVASVCLSICFIVSQFVFQLVPMLFYASVFIPVRRRRSTM